MRIYQITDLDELHQWINLIQRSHVAISKPRGANAQIPYEGYIATIFQCLKAWPEGGIFGAVNESGQQLGFTVVLNHSERYSNRKTLLAYTVYTTGEDPATIRELVKFVEDKARDAGYTEVEAHSGRFSGATRKWFDKVLKMKRHKIVYKKDL